MLPPSVVWMTIVVIQCDFGGGGGPVVLPPPPAKGGGGRVRGPPARAAGAPIRANASSSRRTGLLDTSRDVVAQIFGIRSFGSTAPATPFSRPPARCGV